ncbi:Acyltransferase family protein [Histomonas meleagridis]|uniref:Acyltransferase family protein n=1 Tax=Histomonas meleagridis TaxID=135588 RepID=UPI00355A535C|nr:Acyltransferase family protein [Histomonas meleagridis]KAH0799877.1 Acyltransferase family protein [Histomonas meleagridis]
MITLVPTFDPKLQNQTKLSEISDEEFNKGIIPTKSTTKDRIIQVILFILGFGWLRFLLLIGVTILYAILVIPSVIFHKFPFILNFGINLSRVYFRVAFFLLGLSWLTFKGKLDPKAKCILFNHQTVLDGPLIYILKPFTVLGMAELKKAFLIGNILTANGTVFVDRSKHEGASQKITEYLESDTQRPMVLAPEGKTTKGQFLLQFRTGSFIAHAPIQCATIRYRQFFAYGGAGIVWAVGGFKEWLWRILCLPMFTVEIEFLPLMDGEEFLKKTPQEKALECNLLMANKLGVRATNRSSRNMFKNKKE